MDEEFTRIQHLAASVIGQAVDDIRQKMHGQTAKVKGKIYHYKRFKVSQNDRIDARDFLETHRLEEWIDIFHLDLDHEDLRKKLGVMYRQSYKK